MRQRLTTAVAVVMVAILAFVGLGALRDESEARPEAPAKTGRAAKKRGTGALEADDVPVVTQLQFRPAVPETFQRERSLFAYTKSPATLKQERDAAEAARIAAERQAAADLKAAQERAEEERIRREAQDKIDAERRLRDAEELRLHPPKPPPPVPPEFTYEYVGVVGPEEDPYAILMDRSKKFSYARAGDVVDAKFRVDRVGRLAMDVGFTSNQFKDQVVQVQRTFRTDIAVPTTPPPPSSRTPKRR